MVGAWIAGCRFVAVDFSGTLFEKANGHAAEFVDVDLRNAEFRGACLSDASFVRCDLSGARFCGADVRGARLLACQGLTLELADQLQERGAKISEFC